MLSQNNETFSTSRLFIQKINPTSKYNKGTFLWKGATLKIIHVNIYDFLNGNSGNQMDSMLYVYLFIFLAFNLISGIGYFFVWKEWKVIRSACR